ncbi:MAG: AAA family ATPase [Nanoarchaeota archaeon]|nr:AAA family ATPase [Nanoarchaeota archaeon]
MVELPLKHPEVFERLGIEPPKGVLLHGPPGTGKTLLAKAVANETNSHFLVINGPEIMCVGADTPIFTNPRGYKKIKDVFNAAKGKKIREGKIEAIKLDVPIKSYGFHDNKLTKVSITHVAKLKAPTYALEFSDGNKIETSHNQPFLVYENGQLSWKRVEELSEGMFVARVNKLDLPNESKETELPQKVVVKGGKYSLPSKNVSRSNFISLPRKTSPDLLEYVGLLVAEGNISKEGDAITFCNLDPALKARYKELLKNLFGIAEVKEYKDGRVVIYSKTLSAFLEQFGLFAGKKQLNVPGYFYTIPKEEIAAFIRGYFDGDGTVALAQMEGYSYPTPKLYSKSKEFLQQLQSLMMLKLGISAKLQRHPTPKGEMQALVVRGYEGRMQFWKQVGSATPAKAHRLAQIVHSMKKREFANIPTPKLLLQELRSKVPYKVYRNNDYYVYEKGDFTKHALHKLYGIATEAKALNSSLKTEYDTLMRDDLAWEKITHKSFVGEKELYDFTVDKDNFMGGPLLLLHNSKYYGQSEENLRKKFEEAEKSAPSIIFIDEIDAIASKREETKGEVERRVVAQLLALMDGLKSRGKVVVIAATNVPNILDPALRRPGRFDREIEIGVPSKEGRLNILKIHTRGMPLYSMSFATRDLKECPENYRQALFALTDSVNKFMSKKDLETVIQKHLKDHPDKNALFKDIASDKLYALLRQVFSNPALVDLEDIASITHGFVGADLAALAKESAMIVLRRVLPELKLQEEEAIPKELLEQLQLTNQDFRDALKVVRPSALREVLIDIPDVHWIDIGGLEPVKQELKEAVEWPLKNPDAFKRMGIRPPKGVLMYGAPGTGKTLLAKAVATESESNFILVKGPELLSKWVGESEKAVREIFKKARQTSPTIIFFDEIDALAPRRGMSGDNHVSERVVNQLLTEIDGLEEMHDVVIIAATNRPDIVDTALLRPGRFDRIILVPAPDMESRLEILKVHTKRMPLKNVDINELAKRTEGYAGADIESICREAAIIALRKNIKAKEVTMEHFEAALLKVPASVTPDIEKAYEDLQGHFSSARAKQMKDELPSYMG